MKLKPVDDKILVQPDETETQTASGIYLPDQAQEKPVRGTVLAVGPGRITDTGELIPANVDVGDRVLYSKYGGTEIDADGVPMIIIAPRDVLAVVGA